MKKVLSIIVIISLMLITAGDTLAGSNTGVMHIRAKVLPIAKYTILHQESNLTITPADIDRGFLDVHNAMILSIKTNSTNGFLLVVFVDNGPFSGLTVFDGNNAYRLSDSGGEVHIPYQGKNVTKELSFRFHLLTDAKPGRYSWPVAFMINAM